MHFFTFGSSDNHKLTINEINVIRFYFFIGLVPILKNPSFRENNEGKQVLSEPVFCWGMPMVTYF